MAARAKGAPNPVNDGDMQDNATHQPAIAGQNCKVGIGIRLGI